MLHCDNNRVKLINLIEECDYVNTSCKTDPLDLDENLERINHMTVKIHLLSVL